MKMKKIAEKYIPEKNKGSMIVFYVVMGMSRDIAWRTVYYNEIRSATGQADRTGAIT